MAGRAVSSFPRAVSGQWTYSYYTGGSNLPLLLKIAVGMLMMTNVVLVSQRIVCLLWHI